ncbi:MAG: TIGR00341 family protein [Desulfobacterales bacterium]
MIKKFEISRERFVAVHKDISDGSEPALRFYILVAVSTLIACFGLIANSTAVVIGAMLVAPLMTPIFGISLALVRGESDLLGRASRAEIIGVVAAVSMGFVLGSLLGEIEPTPEMLSRTRPNLFDLLVAVLAGFAGAFALVNEKISPALPGVAIATAIVPPLANSGLCLALGEVQGGIGSFLLFFANFLSILVVASGTFILSGMAKHYGAQAEHRDYIRRFTLPIVAFILIGTFLVHSLLQMYEERRITKTIKHTLTEATSHIPATYLIRVRHYRQADTVHVMASLHTPKFLTPTQVSNIQNQLSERIGMPAELLTHCIISNNVSATGSLNTAVIPKLDGTFVKSSENDALNDIAATEQIIREHFASDRSLDLIRVEPMLFKQRKIMMAHVFGFREVTPEEVGILQTRIREATGEGTVELVFSNLKKTLIYEQGTIRYGWIRGIKGTPENLQRLQKVRADLESAFARDDAYDLVNINATLLDDKLHFLLEIAGPEVYPSQKVEALESQLGKKYSEPIKIYAWSRIEVVNGSEGPISLTEFHRSFSERQKGNFPEELPIILEPSSR